MATAARVAEVQRIFAEGRAAAVGAPNPYNGQVIEAMFWRYGYRQMVEAKDGRFAGETGVSESTSRCLAVVAAAPTSSR